MAEGAKFNSEPRQAMAGAPVHNPFLIENLLIASINEMKTTYGLTAQTNVEPHADVQAAGEQQLTGLTLGGPERA